MKTREPDMNTMLFGKTLDNFLSSPIAKKDILSKRAELNTT
jgi:hypothetical protein